MGGTTGHKSDLFAEQLCTHTLDCTVRMLPILTITVQLYIFICAQNQILILSNAKKIFIHMKYHGNNPAQV